MDLNNFFQTLPMWNIEELTGYTPQTTFWQDFSIADRFGISAVQDTFNNAFASWRTDYIYLTELVLVLNWKIWQHHDQENEQLSTLYNTLWEQADQYAMDNLKDNELSYFITTTD